MTSSTCQPGDPNEGAFKKTLSKTGVEEIQKPKRGRKRKMVGQEKAAGTKKRKRDSRNGNSDLHNEDMESSSSTKQKKIAKKEKKKKNLENDAKRFRIRSGCTMLKLVELNTKIKENKQFKLKRREILRTPFKHFLEIENITVNHNLLQVLLRAWDERSWTFNVCDDKSIRFDLHYVESLFSFRAAGTEIQVSKDYGTSKVHDLLRSLGVITVPGLYDLLADGETSLSSQDYCRLYIAFVFASFLFPLSSNRIYMNFFKLLDNLDELNTFRWGKAVYDFLVKGISYIALSLRTQLLRTADGAFDSRMRGCTPLLQIWAAQLAGMQLDKSIPLKWTKSCLTAKEVGHIVSSFKVTPMPLLPYQEDASPYEPSAPGFPPKDWLRHHMLFLPTDADIDLIEKWKVNVKVDEFLKEIDRNDLESLLSKKGLSNTVVDEYIKVLAKHMPHCFFIKTYVGIALSSNDFPTSLEFRKKWLNIMPHHKKIFLPIVHNNRWTLMVIDRHKERLFWLGYLDVYDCQRFRQQVGIWVNNMIVKQQGKQQVKDWRIERLKTSPPKVDDTGIYMLTHMVCLAVGDEILEFRKVHIQPIRQRIFLEIRRKRLLPPLPDYKYFYADYDDLMQKYEQKCADYEELMRNYKGRNDDYHEELQWIFMQQTSQRPKGHKCVAPPVIKDWTDDDDRVKQSSDDRVKQANELPEDHGLVVSLVTRDFEDNYDAEVENAYELPKVRGLVAFPVTENSIDNDDEEVQHANELPEDHGLVASLVVERNYDDYHELVQQNKELPEGHKRGASPVTKDLAYNDDKVVVENANELSEDHDPVASPVTKKPAYNDDEIMKHANKLPKDHGLAASPQNQKFSIQEFVKKFRARNLH